MEITLTSSGRRMMSITATNERGEKAVSPIYRESEEKPSLYIDFTEISQVHKAIWLFRRIEAVVPQV